MLRLPPDWATIKQPPPSNLPHADRAARLFEVGGALRDEVGDMLADAALERVAVGIETYGSALSRSNGRDHAVDALQELADAAIYIAALWDGRREAHVQGDVWSDPDDLRHALFRLKQVAASIAVVVNRRRAVATKFGETPGYERPPRATGKEMEQASPADTARAVELSDALAASSEPAPPVRGGVRSMSKPVVHIAGQSVQIGPFLRQRCAWCGALLIDLDLSRVMVAPNEDGTPGAAPGEWPAGQLVEVSGSNPRVSRVLEHDDGAQLPPHACIDGGAD